MRTIAHISDLHFGRLDSATLPALTAAINAAKPDVVAVSGDLTQRARSSEFAAARQFLETLPKPQIVVPGNHDVPLYNVFRRWWDPLKNYRQYISDDAEPFFADGEIAIQGLNTARSLTFKDGRINAAQVERSCGRLRKHPDSATRVLVTHHPFDTPDPDSATDIVGRAEMAMAGFARCGVDIILTGHMHVSRTSDSVARYNIPGHGILFIQAGTATSIRQRGELNAWNLIYIEEETIRVECLTWSAQRGRFAVSNTDLFARTPGGRSLPQEK